MKQLLLLFLFLPLWAEAQIKSTFIIKADSTEVDLYKVEGKWDEQIYLRTNYGDYTILNPKEAKRLKGKIIQKVQLVYSDYPKGSDLSALNERRLHALQALLPEVFNTSWVQWEFVKQTKFSSMSQASSAYHGFVIFIKSGSPPNTVITIPPHIQAKLKKIKTKVTYTETDTSKKTQKEYAEKIASFLSGIDVVISNLHFNDSLSFGKNHFLFEEKDGTINILDGLLMTTGLAINALGPNDCPNKSHVFSNIPIFDKDLKKISTPGNLYDACILEFDLKINADTLLFNYLFGSEEYPEYLNFHDVFGIFLTGPGYEKSVNIAMIPNKNIPVAVNNINHLVNKDLYLSNEMTKDLKVFKAWQYDGFTVRMQSKIPIERNKKYHMKLVIADYGDPYYDSGIFIQAKGIQGK